MLAVLQIKMHWTKENRTPDGARRRQQYYAPVLIEPELCYRVKWFDGRRHACYDGQWYECYYVYVVNTDRLSHDVFIHNYTYNYDQLADLF